MRILKVPLFVLILCVAVISAASLPRVHIIEAGSQQATATPVPSGIAPAQGRTIYLPITFGKPCDVRSWPNALNTDKFNIVQLCNEFTIHSTQYIPGDGLNRETYIFWFCDPNSQECAPNTPTYAMSCLWFATDAAEPEEAPRCGTGGGGLTLNQTISSTTQLSVPTTLPTPASVDQPIPTHAPTKLLTSKQLDRITKAAEDLHAGKITPQQAELALGGALLGVGLGTVLLVVGVVIVVGVAAYLLYRLVDATITELSREDLSAFGYNHEYIWTPENVMLWRLETEPYDSGKDGFLDGPPDFVRMKLRVLINFNSMFQEGRAPQPGCQFNQEDNIVLLTWVDAINGKIGNYLQKMDRLYSSGAIHTEPNSIQLRPNKGEFVQLPYEHPLCQLARRSLLWRIACLVLLNPEACNHKPPIPGLYRQLLREYLMNIHRSQRRQLNLAGAS